MIHRIFIFGKVIKVATVNNLRCGNIKIIMGKYLVRFNQNNNTIGINVSPKFQHNLLTSLRFTYNLCTLSIKQDRLKLFFMGLILYDYPRLGTLSNATVLLLFPNISNLFHYSRIMK